MVQLYHMAFNDNTVEDLGAMKRRPGEPCRFSPSPSFDMLRMGVSAAASKASAGALRKQQEVRAARQDNVKVEKTRYAPPTSTMTGGYLWYDSDATPLRRSSRGVVKHLRPSTRHFFHTV